jgi:lipopolysaccharide transport system ATP-binding protein
MSTLLEVGTGFHPELTGRENIFLSGAILGMSKREIERKFDEMVDFAGVERFIDTPLKHYSTGMQMRLAFGVAAHLEPEILLVDEVLAVGDLAFQKKCLGKMSEVAQGGRTIIFVSHQMNQIRRLCQRVLWLDQGQVRTDGPAGEVVAAYEAAQMDLEQRSATGLHCFLSWELAGQEDHILKDNFKEVEFRVRVRLAEPLRNGHLGIGIVNESGFTLVGWGFDQLDVPAGLQEFALKVPLLPLRPGAYSLNFSLFNEGNNLTGGKSVESWQATPLLMVDTAPLAHAQDSWAGVLNIGADLEILQTVDRAVDRSFGERTR